MKVLMLGGTSFIGRHMVEKLLENRHEVVLFNRGKSNPTAFPNLRRITGDRRKDAAKLTEEKWDAVIDTSAYTPSDLKPILENIKTDHYTFISTISVYNDFRHGPVNENSPVFQNEIKGDKVTSETYGPLKVMCEKLIKESIEDKALIIRPGIVIGPLDPTDRFTYWAIKLNGTEAVLVPGSKGRKVQWIDAIDLAAFTISLLERKVKGIFNVVADSVSMEEFVLQTTCGEPDTVWADEQFLMEKGIQSFELPFWMPYSKNYLEGFILAANEKAKSRGLTFRALKQYAQDTLEWVKKEEDFQVKIGISREKERNLLEEVKKRT